MESYEEYAECMSSGMERGRKSLSEADSVTSIDEQTLADLNRRVWAFQSTCQERIKKMDDEHEKYLSRKKGWEGQDTSGLTQRELTSRCWYKMTNRLKGWFHAPYDPNELITQFDCLSLRKGFHLESYQYLDGQGNGSAKVYVMPDDRSLPKKPPGKAFFLENIESWNSVFYGSPPKKSRLQIAWESMRGLLLPAYRPVPAWALRNIMPLIEGNGTPLSFFQASIYERDLCEMGSLWHNLYWGTHQVIASMIGSPDEEWTWEADLPDDLSPAVWQDRKGKWNVIFYSYCGKDAQLHCHYDAFSEGYVHTQFSSVMGSHPGGYEF